MIAVDTNIICYRWMHSNQSAPVDQVLLKDPDWIAPLLWRSEFRNVLAGAMRNRRISPDNAIDILERAEASMLGREFLVSSRTILRLVQSSRCSAYDCEFVALAEEQGISLLTADLQILRTFPKLTVSLENFVRR
jgi:predicted nucleic acid-binding protein